MGSDIHVILERKEPDGSWLGVYASDCIPDARSKPAFRRDYAFFEKLAFVRPRNGGLAPPEAKPKGFPPHASRLTEVEYKKWRGDAHSTSYLPAEEFVKRWTELYPNEAAVMWLGLEFHLLGIDVGDKPTEFRVVFWFDN